MYVRTVKRPHSCKRCVQIVESYRTPNGVAKRILRHVGSADVGPQLDTLQRIAEIELARMRAEHDLTLFPPEHLADLHAYESGIEAEKSLGKYFRFYNTRRPHMGLNRRKPVEVYFAAAQSPLAA